MDAYDRATPRRAECSRPGGGAPACATTGYAPRDAGSAPVARRRAHRLAAVLLAAVAGWSRPQLSPRCFALSPAARPVWGAGRGQPGNAAAAEPVNSTGSTPGTVAGC